MTGKNLTSCLVVGFYFFVFSLSVQAQRTDYALLFATDEYDELEDISTIDGTRQLAETLKDQYGFETELVENFTVQDVMSKLREYFGKEYGEYDQLFIYFGGHGFFDIVFKQGYIACQNSIEPIDDFDTYVEFTNLKSLLNRMPCPHIFLALNTGYARYIDPEMIGVIRSSDSVRFETTEVTIENEEVAGLLDKQSRFFLANGGDQFRLEEYDSFLSSLLTLLNSKDEQDGMHNVEDVTRQMRTALPIPRSGNFGAHQIGGEFLFIAR